MSRIIVRMDTKKCSKCGEIKPLNEFRKDKNKLLGLQSHCKKCSVEYDKNYRLNNQDKIRAYSNTEQRKKQVADHCQKWYLQNKEKAKEYQKNRITRDPEKNLLRHRLYHAKQYGFDNLDDYYQYLKNKKTEKAIDRIMDKALIMNRKYDLKKNKLPQNERLKIKRKEDIQYKLSDNMRCRIRKAFRNACIKKNKRTFDLIGCTGKQLVDHLLGMGYDARIHQIDHIIPISAFDLINAKHQLIACHYLNLQPMTPHDNNSKHHALPDNWEERIINICSARNIVHISIIDDIRNKQL